MNKQIVSSNIQYFVKKIVFRYDKKDQKPTPLPAAKPKHVPRDIPANEAFPSKNVPSDNDHFTNMTDGVPQSAAKLVTVYPPVPETRPNIKTADSNANAVKPGNGITGSAIEKPDNNPKNKPQIPGNPKPLPIHTPSQHTSEDMYYSIRQEFYCQLVGSGVDFFKDEIIQNLRTAADEETEDYIKDALFDVADDIEKDRNMLICDCNFNDCLTSSWICEDISEYKNGEYTLIVNSVYGRPETYIVGIASGRIKSSMVYSEEMEAELRNQGKEIIDRR